MPAHNFADDRPEHLRVKRGKNRRDVARDEGRVILSIKVLNRVHDA